MTKTRLFLALALVATIGAVEANNKRHTQKQTNNNRTTTEQTVRQSTTQTTKLYAGEQTTVFVDAAQAPGGVIGKCLAAYGVALANNGWSISFGTNRRLRSCEARELAAMLFAIGTRSKDAEMIRMAKALLSQQFDDIQRKRKVRHTCKRPVAEHCTTGARAEGER